MANAQRYPFNMNKHQHDIFFRYNRCKNELDDKLADREYHITDAEIDRYEALIDALGHILDYGIGIVWLTGKEYGLAHETVLWAGSMRG